MQIHYIWVNDFARLQKAGITLSAQFIFSMEADEENEGSYQLTISENPDFIPGFFGRENVTNVTAIIGKNGAGKTTILNYIKQNLPLGLEAQVRNDLFVYSSGDGNEQQYVVIKPNFIDVRVVNLTHFRFKEEDYGDDAANSLRFTGALSNAEYIYYSYLLHFDEDVKSWSGLTNISTAYLMMEERKRISEEERDSLTRTNLLSQCNDLDNLHISEVAMAIQFLISDIADLPFNKPDYLNIEIDLMDALFFTGQESIYPEIAKILNAFQSEINANKIKEENVVNNFLLAIFINFLINDFKYSVGTAYFHPIKPVNETPVRQYILDYFSTMSDIQTEEGLKFNSERHSNLSVTVPELVNVLQELIEQKQIIVGNGTAMLLKLDVNTEEIFKRFSKLYLKVKGISAFLKFRWRQLSGGEQSYLSLMSRFYHVKHHRIGDLPPTLVILIDEGDIAYHPEWQRRFFNITLNFLSTLFADHRIQLIMTANTPFLSSDLPKPHVLFVELIDKKLSIFHGKNNNRDSTFAANIHTLYSDSFYMNGVLMGEFAKERINTIIRYLNSPLADQQAPDENYKKTIDLIGEPALRKKLQDMWMDKFGDDEEIRILEERIASIKRRKLPPQQ